MIKIKIQDGTRPDRHLCENCYHGHIIKGQAQGQERTYCTKNDNNEPLLHIQFKVAECNKYAEKDNRQAPKEYERNAYYIEKLPNTGAAIALTYNQYYDSHFRLRLNQADAAHGTKTDKYHAADQIIARVTGLPVEQVLAEREQREQAIEKRRVAG